MPYQSYELAITDEDEFGLDFAALSLPMATLDAEGRVLLSNRALAALFEVHPASLIGEDLVERLVNRAAEVETAGTRRVFHIVEIELWLRLDLQPQSGGFLAMLVDVTAEHARFVRLRDLFNGRDRLMHDAEIGTWRYDPDTQTYYFSSELALGWDSIGDPVPLATLQKIQHKDDQAIDTAIRERLTTEGGSAEAEMRYRDGSGGWRHLRALYRSGQRLPSGKFEMYGLSQDVTALARARDAAEAATASQSNFLASVSHEIRTPMNGIVGVLNLLERERLSDEGRDLLGEALACSDMLGQLINDVLDFSKMEAGKLDITAAPTDPAAVASSVVALLHPQADAKNLYLRAAVDLESWALIDPVRLRQCLFNVIGNAVKFTSSGGVELRMAYVGADGERRLRCEVQDTGIGIPEAAQAVLFERFHQAESGTTRKYGGTGLGLAISRSLARMMGGDMGFESREGEGSTFWFEIAAPPAEAVSAVAPASEQAEQPLHGLRVLLVDDNRTNRIIGLKSLEALGAEAESADSGTAAIAAAARGGLDLILMDINMPGMDGIEATQRIRALGSPEADVPIVALTADVMTHHQQAYFAAGLNGFVPKPFSPAQLLAEIVRLSQ